MTRLSLRFVFAFVVAAALGCSVASSTTDSPGAEIPDPALDAPLAAGKGEQTAIVAGGPLAMWCIVGVGLFTSIGWSNTFSLAIEGVGPLKSQASSLLVMAVLGGALLPPLQGLIADHAQLQYSFIVPAIAYAYVAFYGIKGCRIGRKD